jgi:hypothetical protein
MSNACSHSLRTKHYPILSTKHYPILSTKHYPILHTKHYPILSTKHNPTLSTKHYPILSTKHYPILHTKHYPILRTKHYPTLRTNHYPISCMYLSLCVIPFSPYSNSTYFTYIGITCARLLHFHRRCDAILLTSPTHVPLSCLIHLGVSVLYLARECVMCVLGAVLCPCACVPSFLCACVAERHG